MIKNNQNEKFANCILKPLTAYLLFLIAELKKTLRKTMKI